MILLRWAAVAAACLFLSGAALAQAPSDPQRSSPPGSQRSEIPGRDGAQPQKNQDTSAREAPILNAPEAQQQQQAGRKNGQRDDAKGAGEESHSFYESLIAYFTIALAAATILLMMATFFLWWETRKLAGQAKITSDDTKSALALSQASLELATSNAAKEYRAYLRMSVTTGTVEIGRKPSFDMNIINYGRTPALHTATAGAAVVRDADWKWSSENAIPSGDRPRHTLHPGDPEFGFTLECDSALTSDVYEALKAGEACIFGRAIIEYEDVFGEPRKTSIVFEFSGPTCFDRGAPRISSNGSFAT